MEVTIKNKISQHLLDCKTISELLWDTEQDVNQETINNVGVMLYRKIKKIEKNLEKLFAQASKEKS